MLYRYDLVMFCLKQKTAYEMRISDWSSHVCSSGRTSSAAAAIRSSASFGRTPSRVSPSASSIDASTSSIASRLERWSGWRPRSFSSRSNTGSEVKRHVRSEEHTSELQSLMRISYDVFCLKKKNKTTKIH